MALTPVEVEHTQFRVAFRGYAIDEVDAFLDRVQSELARLLSEQAATPAAAAAEPASSGPEGQEAALRTLLLAQRTADEAVAEARAEADQILSSAREEAERVLAASRAEAAGLDEQIAARLEAALGDLDRRRSRLDASIEELRAFEREYRTRLRAFLEGQLRELAGSGAPDDGAGVPVGAGGAAVGRTAVGAVRLDNRAGPQDGVPTPAGAAGTVATPDPAGPTTER